MSAEAAAMVTAFEVINGKPPAYLYMGISNWAQLQKGSTVLDLELVIHEDGSAHYGETEIVLVQREDHMGTGE